MAFQPVAATALVEMIFLLDGQIVENTLYFRRANDYTVADLTALTAAMITWWVTLQQAQLSTAISLTAVKATALHSQTGPQFTNTATLPVAGAVPTDAVPNNSAFCLTLRTALIGRAFRGRNYIAGIPESVVTTSRLSSTVATALKNGYGGIPSSIPAGTTWVVVSRTVNGVLQLPTALTNPVTSVDFVDLVMDSQRRRLPGRGQ